MDNGIRLSTFYFGVSNLGKELNYCLTLTKQRYSNCKRILLIYNANASQKWIILWERNPFEKICLRNARTLHTHCTQCAWGCMETTYFPEKLISWTPLNTLKKTHIEFLVLQRSKSCRRNSDFSFHESNSKGIYYITLSLVISLEHTLKITSLINKQRFCTKPECTAAWIYSARWEYHRAASCIWLPPPGILKT